jgi:MYXO-CTERM domain-containing protein
VDTVSPAPPVFQEPTSARLLFASEVELSGTAEHDSSVTVFVDGVRIGVATADKDGKWKLTSPPLKWATHHATAMSTDPTGNTSVSSFGVTFTIAKRSHYGFSCTTGPSASLPWPWALLALGLLRGRRPR